MKKKGDLDISFGWIFGVIIGGFILFLAVFAAMKIIGVEETTQDAKTGKEIGILLNPLETNFESGKTSSLTMPVDTRIYNKCNNKNNFGRQIIQVSQKSFNKWTQTDIDVGFSNKYIFSENYTEGKTFYIFSKPFEFPFKVADVIYITSVSEKYCFINPPTEVFKELESLNQKNIYLNNCSGGAKICFDDFSECDIKVNYKAKYVDKAKGRIYFEGDSLMYAAIFSDKEVYECGVKRLMQRIEQLTLLYQGKANFISRAGCNSNVNSELMQLNAMAKNLDNSADLSRIVQITEDIQYKNDLADCKLW